MTNDRTSRLGGEELQRPGAGPRSWSPWLPRWPCSPRRAAGRLPRSHRRAPHRAAAAAFPASVDARRRRRRRTRATPARGHDHLLDLGRPDRDQEPAGDRRRVPRGQPEDHRQGDRVRLGPLLGQAPDRDRRRRRARRLRDGRPALPRLPVARRPARPQAVSSTATATTSASSPTRRSPTSPRRTASTACRATSTSIALYYNKKMFDAAGHPLPGRHLGLGEARRGRQAADDQGRRRQGRASGASTPRRPTWRTTGRRSSGRTAATSCRPTRRRALVGSDQAAGGIQFLQDLIWKDKVMPDPAISGGQRRRVRAGQGRDGGERLVARRDRHRRPGSTSGSRRCRRARPARPPRSTRPAPSSTRARRARTPPGSS